MKVLLLFLFFISIAFCARDLQLFSPNDIGKEDMGGLMAASQKLHMLIKQVQSRSHEGEKSNLEGFSTAQPKQVEFYLRAGNLSWIETVCETGFNGGHSALSLLYGSKTSRLISFDFMDKTFHPTVQRAFEESFGKERIQSFVAGDSTKTLPEFVKSNGGSVKCSIISIDGGHTLEVARSDIDNFFQLADCNHILLMDDIFQKYANKWNVHHVDGAKDAWVNAINQNKIKQFGCYEYYEDQEEIWRDKDVWGASKRLPRAFCAGTFVLPNCPHNVGVKAIKSILKVMDLPPCDQSGCN